MKYKPLFIAVIAFITLLTAGNSFGQDVNIHGFVSQGYILSSDNSFIAMDTEDGTFEFNELGINFSTKVKDNLKIGMQIFARDIGDIGEDEPCIDWAFGDYSWREWLGLRAGYLKVPLGLYNETRDVDCLRTSILLPQSVYSEWDRDLNQGAKGMSAYGNLPTNMLGNFRYEFMAFALDIPMDSGVIQHIESYATVKNVSSFTIDDVYLLGLKWDAPVTVGNLMFGFNYIQLTVEQNSIMYLPQETAASSKLDSVNMIFSLEYIWEDLTIASEMRLIERDTSSLLPIPQLNRVVDATSYYVSAAYRFNEFFELGTYYC